MIRSKNFNASNITTTRRVSDRRTAVSIANGYQNGKSMDALSSATGVSTVAIRTLLTVNGIRIRPRGRYARNQFQNV